MTKNERLVRLRAYVKSQGTSTIQEIASYLGVSHMTIRRDLNTLNPGDPIRVIHGGVVYKEEEAEQHSDKYCLQHAKRTRYEEKMRSVLGIRIDDSLLPLSNINGAYFPFMLDTGRVFAK